MKLIALITLTLATLTLQANDQMPQTAQECTQKCSLYSYNFTPDSLGYCEQIEKCTVYVWENDQCYVEQEEVLRSYPIACRDIPAY